MDAATAMQVLVRIVERGSFSRAADDLGITPSAVSRLISRLEDRLGVRLLHRTTRRLSLTPEGETYHLRARDILAAIADADAEAAGAGQTPRGRLRVNCTTAFALHHLVPALPDFSAHHPEVKIELAVSDRVIDLLAENADVAIRVAESRSSLVARKIVNIERSLFASPDYLTRRGVPRSPEQLRNHDCIILVCFPQVITQFRVGGNVEDTRFEQRSGRRRHAALRFAIAGGGIGRLADAPVADDVRAGSSFRCWRIATSSARPLNVVYPQGRHPC
jgi:DNA-binding transcriptional LysR family regulator